MPLHRGRGVAQIGQRQRCVDFDRVGGGVTWRRSTRAVVCRADFGGVMLRQVCCAELCGGGVAQILVASSAALRGGDAKVMKDAAIT